MNMAASNGDHECPGAPMFMPFEALMALIRYIEKVDFFSIGVVQALTRKFPNPGEWTN